MNVFTTLNLYGYRNSVIKTVEVTCRLDSKSSISPFIPTGFLQILIVKHAYQFLQGSFNLIEDNL